MNGARFVHDRLEPAGWQVEIAGAASASSCGSSRSASRAWPTSAAAGAIERLIRAAGFDPLKAGGVADARRLEAPDGDLQQSGLNGAVLDIDQARSAVDAEVPA